MRYLVLVLPLFAAACATLAGPPPMAREIDAVLADCARRAQAGELTTKEAEARCQADGTLRVFEKWGANDMDLIRLASDKSIELGRRMDTGSISEQQAGSEFDGIWAQIEAEMDRRDRQFGKGSRHAPEGNRPEGNCQVIETRLECVSL